MSDSLYDTWYHMVDRCCNPRCPEYEHYGGRGITVAAAWAESYRSFLEYVLRDLGPRPTPSHTLDRVRNGEGYAPGNLRWATRSEQNRNRRNNRLITAWGKTQTLAAWAEEHGVAAATIAARLKHGWDPGLAVRQPLVRRPKRDGDHDGTDHPAGVPGDPG
jgi:hypothetical protein